MASDAYGLPIDFIITGGEVHDCKIAPEFIAQLPFANYTIVYRIDAQNKTVIIVAIKHRKDVYE